MIAAWLSFGGWIILSVHGSADLCEWVNASWSSAFGAVLWLWAGLVWWSSDNTSSNLDFFFLKHTNPVLSQLENFDQIFIQACPCTVSATRGCCVSEGFFLPLEDREVLERLRRRSPLLRRHTCWIRLETPERRRTRKCKPYLVKKERKKETPAPKLKPNIITVSSDKMFSQLMKKIYNENPFCMHSFIHPLLKVLTRMVL